jgi:hypothetical protein
MITDQQTELLQVLVIHRLCGIIHKRGLFVMWGFSSIFLGRYAIYDRGSRPYLFVSALYGERSTTRTRILIYLKRRKLSFLFFSASSLYRFILFILTGWTTHSTCTQTSRHFMERANNRKFIFLLFLFFSNKQIQLKFCFVQIKI